MLIFLQESLDQSTLLSVVAYIFKIIWQCPLKIYQVKFQKLSLFLKSVNKICVQICYAQGMKRFEGFMQDFYFSVPLKEQICSYLLTPPGTASEQLTPHPLLTPPTFHSQSHLTGMYLTVWGGGLCSCFVIDQDMFRKKFNLSCNFGKQHPELCFS